MKTPYSLSTILLPIIMLLPVPNVDESQMPTVEPVIVLLITVFPAESEI